MIVHFGETLPHQLEPEHIIGYGMLTLWALAIYGVLLFTFGIGAATGWRKELPYSVIACWHSWVMLDGDDRHDSSLSSR